MKIVTKSLPLLITLVSVLIIFYPSLSNFFFQDDFIVIYMGWIENLTDFKRIFLSFLYFPMLSYRPLTFLFFGSTTFHLLNLNPFLLHTVLFILYFFTLYLFWKMLAYFFPDTISRFCCLFLYSVSLIHFGVLYWMTAAFVLLGTLFLLISLSLILRFEATKSIPDFILALIFFVLTLLTNEGLFAFPIYLLLSRIIRKKETFNLLPLFIVSGISIVFRKAISGFQMLPYYRIGNLAEFIKTFQWYLFRAVNIPEGIRSFPEILQISISIFILLIISISLYSFYYLWIKKKYFSRNIVLGFSWFLFLGFPYFLLPSHLSSYYLHTALIGFMIAWVSLLQPIIASKRRLHKVLLFTFVITWFILSSAGVRYLHNTSWMIRRGEIARKYIQRAKKIYPRLPQGSTLIFQHTKVQSLELSNALYNGIALKLYYNDPQLQVIFDEAYIPKPNDKIVTD